MAAPTYTPVPVPKVFSHKAMVGATRQKYLQLPEVVAADPLIDDTNVLMLLRC